MLVGETAYTGGEFSIEQLEDTLDRLANIAAGISWQHDKESSVAFDNMSLVCVALLYHLNVPRTMQTERCVKGAIEKGIKVYYAIAPNGKWYARGKPEGIEVVNFWDLKSKSA